MTEINTVNGIFFKKKWKSTWQSQMSTLATYKREYDQHMILIVSKLNIVKVVPE